MLFHRESGEIVVPQDRYDFDSYEGQGFIDLSPDLIQRVEKAFSGLRRITLSEKSPLLAELRAALPAEKAPRRRGKKS